MTKLVSCIITTYNRSDLLSRAISSVLNQTYKSLECIVVDDASTDSTSEVIKDFSDSRLIYIRHKENKHLSAARNTGIRNSRGNLVAFLDDDDKWLPEKLEKQVKCISNSSPQVGLVYCWFDIYKSTEMVEIRHPQLRGYIFDDLLVSQPLGNGSTLLVKRNVIDQIGLFDETLRRGIDGDFIRRVGQYYEIEVVPEVLVHYFIDHDGNPRITGNDKQSLLNGLRSHEVKLEKFGTQLDAKPLLKAQLLSEISLFHAKLGHTSSCLSNIYLAFKVFPLTKKNYLNAVKSILILISTKLTPSIYKNRK